MSNIAKSYYDEMLKRHPIRMRWEMLKYDVSFRIWFAWQWIVDGPVWKQTGSGESYDVELVRARSGKKYEEVQ